MNREFLFVVNYQALILPYLALPTSLFCVFPALGKTGECLGRTQRALTSRSPRATSRNLVLQAKFAYIKLVCGNYRKLFFLLCSWFLLNSGEAVYDQSGELVCTKPFPCMPIYFWNDPQGLKYKKAYFNKFVGELQNSIYCTSVLT